MTPPPSDDAWVQSSVTWQLLDFVAAPVHGEAVVRGVLPAPGGGSTLRVVTGERHAPLTELSAWELPLTDGDQLLTGSATLGLVRAQLARAGQPLGPGVRDAGSVMGMRLFQIDLERAARYEWTLDDRALSVLRTLLNPRPGNPENVKQPLIRGFLRLERDLLRLYVQPEERPEEQGPVAVDLLPSGPTTVLISLVDTYLREPERYGPDPVNDPHAATYVDLTGYGR